MRNYLIRNDRRNNNADFFDDAFNSFFAPAFYNDNNGRKYRDMKTDIKENESDYELNVEVPGYDKKEINLSLENGYLTISANHNEVEENDKKKYLRQERSYSCQRSFYVGDIKEKNIKAKYDNGVLSVSIPKEQEEKENSHLIEIE